MTTKINIAVIGAGRWGVHLLRNFLIHPQASVVAVVDPNPERLAAIKEQFNLDDQVVLTTHWEVCKQLSLTAVAIATPASTHYPLIKDALKEGFHVLAEKPLTLNPTECLELCQLAEYQNKQLMVDHTYLFHPAVEKGQSIISSGKLGDLRYGYAARTHLGPVRQDVDALWDLAIHDIAIFNNWLNQSPIKVQATGTVWLQPDDTGGWGDESVETTRWVVSSGLADLVWVTLFYPNGFQAYIHLCWLNQDKSRRLGVVGSRGSLIFDEMQQKAPLTLLHGEFERQGNQFIPTNQQQEIVDIEPGEPLQRVCDRFLHSILTNTPSTVSSGWVGTELVKVLAALTESLESGGESVCVIPILSP
jgi:predicted dehydrogenase